MDRTVVPRSALRFFTTTRHDGGGLCEKVMLQVILNVLVDCSFKKIYDKWDFSRGEVEPKTQMDDRWNKHHAVMEAFPV